MHHAQELERDCQNHCLLWIVPGADHGAASTVEPIAFQHKIIRWFESHD